MTETIWLMDSDFCDTCGTLLDATDTDGLCFICSERYLAETSEDDWYEGQDEDYADDAKDINVEQQQKPLDPEAAAIAKQYLEEMLSGTTCPVCHQPITEERQVGRCVYGIPCWHRMYQGTAKPKPEKIHPYFQEQLEQEKRERP